MTKKLQKNESGIAHVLLALLVVVVLAVIGLVAWKVNNNRSTASTAVDKVVQDKCMTEVNDKQLCKFAGVFANVTDYKVAINGTDSTGPSVITLSYDSKNNISEHVTQNGKDQGSVIVYSGVTYVKDSTTEGVWFKFAAGDKNAPAALDLKKEFLKADFKNDSGQKFTYKNLGTEKCDKLTCYKYQETDPAKPTETTYLFIDTKDSLLRRISVSDSTAKTSAEMTITYATVVIAAPSPTKDVPTTVQ